MKITLVMFSCLIIIFLVLFFVLGTKSKQGHAPGLVEGVLTNCSANPNCVCSEHQNDESHYISPIALTQNSSDNALFILKEIIEDMGGTVRSESNIYLAATFSSKLFGFVDDFEIKVDGNQNLIHIRSASRVGHSDMGINKKRVELLKQLYQQKSGVND